jgi:hypothetical protein
MTAYDHLVPAAKSLIRGLAAKPGIHFSDKEMAASLLAQAMHGMIVRGEITLPHAATTTKGTP